MAIYSVQTSTFGDFLIDASNIKDARLKAKRYEKSARVWRYAKRQQPCDCCESTPCVCSKRTKR